MEHRIDEVLNCAGLLPRLKELLVGHGDVTMVEAVLKVLINISSGSESLKHKLLAAGFMQALSRLNCIHLNEEIIIKVVAVDCTSSEYFTLEDYSKSKEATKTLSYLTKGFSLIVPI